MTIIKVKQKQKIEKVINKVDTAFDEGSRDVLCYAFIG